jgi:hypothetical protein
MNDSVQVIGKLLLTNVFMLLCACSAVYSVDPLGENPVQLDAQQWDGDWRGAEGVMKIKVKDAEAGILQVAWIEDMELQQFDVYLLESNGWQFFNVKDEEDENDPSDGYVWGRIRYHENTILLWDPDIRKFRSLVRDGTLPGEARKSGKDKQNESDVVLDKLTQAHLLLITSEEKGVLFDWDEPLVLLKISD